MPIPKYDEMLRPVLSLAVDKAITRREAGAAMADHYELSEEERKERLPSGSATTVSNRAGWAMTFLTKGKLIEKVAPKTYGATAAGKKFLQTHPKRITVKDLQEIEGWEEAWEAGRKKRAAAREKKGKNGGISEEIETSETPEDQIEDATKVLASSLRTELLEQLADVDPYRFEQIVIDVLFAMGYGGSREEAAAVTQKSNDGGIDGVINEDRLGLDVIYVQAKRWQNTVGRVEIQSFVGALAGKQASKGVFITTSDFSKGAIEFAVAVQQKVILIEGVRLADLMIEHNVGVSTVSTVEIKRVDSDYFE